MDRQKYMNMPNAEIPPEIQAALADGGGIRPLRFEDRNRVLTDPDCRTDCGFCRMEDGTWLIAMVCPMPGVTGEMIDWWFWWHPQEDERYQLWYPGEHFKIHTDAKDADYFGAESVPPFRPNAQYPTEKIGKLKMPLRLDFVTPEMFGFSSDALRTQRVSAAVCSHVSAFGGRIPHTEMTHLWFQTEDGLFQVSRFWLGQTLKNPLIRRFMLTEETARGMAVHCCVEYRNLARKLPMLYQEYLQEQRN